MANDASWWSRDDGTTRENEIVSPFARRARIGAPRSTFGPESPGEFMPLPWASSTAEAELLEAAPTYESNEEEEEEGEVVRLAPDGRELESDEALELEGGTEPESYEGELETSEEAPFDPEAATSFEASSDESAWTAEGPFDAGELDTGEVDAGELDAGELDMRELDVRELDEGEERDEHEMERDEYAADEFGGGELAAEAEDWATASFEESSGGGVAIQAGTEVVERVPLLRAHAGIGPDLLLAWNDMSAAPATVDVVVHLHGYAIARGRKLDIVKDLKPRSGLDWSDPKHADATPGRTRPTLALLPRGNFFGGRSGRAYDFPALVTSDGLRTLVDFALARFAARIGVAGLTTGRLILTAHSGGGAPLMRVLRHTDPHEVHVFDGLYGDASALIAWARSRIARDRRALDAGAESAERYMPAHGGALRVLHGAGTATYSGLVAAALRRAIPRGSPLRRWYRVERTTVEHLAIPPVFGWRLLADGGADLPRASATAGVAAQREEPESYVDEAPEYEEEAPASVVFPSGESLPVVTGLPVGAHEDYWDPTNSGLPLLDTGPAYKSRKLSASFTVRELTTSGGVSVDVARIDPTLVAYLQRLRDHLGREIRITSGFRSWKRNVQVYAGRKNPDGTPKAPTLSQHCAGRAADISVDGMSGLELGKAAIDACGPEIGVGIGRTFAHIDVRGKAVAWDYDGKSDAWANEVKRYQRAKLQAAQSPAGVSSASAAAPVASSSGGGGVASVLASLPARIAAAVRGGAITLQVALAIVSGQRDVNMLTSMIFYARHPELPVGRKIQSNEKNLVRQWLDIRDRVVRPLLRALDASSATSAAPAPRGTSGDEGAPRAGELGALVVDAPGRQFHYEFTPDDALWTARFIVGEAGGRDDADNRAVIWAMFNRYAFFTHKVAAYPTFHQFIRAYSTTLQPVLRSVGAARRHMHRAEFVRTGGTYPGTDVPKGQLRRHLDIQSTPWSRLPAPARALAARALRGEVPSPIGVASEFASTRVYYHDRHGRWPSPAEWRRYTIDYAASHQPRWTWIGDVAGLDQMKNAFFVDARLANLPRDSVRVVPSTLAVASHEFV